MRMGPHRARLRAAGASVALACLLAALLAVPAVAAPARLHPTAASTSETARTARYWTAARMRSTPPLDASGGENPLTALASFVSIAEPTVPPFAVNGRLFVRQGNQRGFCSATAIDSASRRLVLTAGHCVNTGPLGPGGHSVWSSLLEFVPAYTGAAPFGAFVAHRKSVFALKQWVKTGNPNFDIGAIVTAPNAEGVNVADAVGGGAAIATDLSRRQDFQTFGYPGESHTMQGCDSPYVGDDSLTYQIPGPPTIAIRCHWAPGASGGGWLIEDGSEIDGLTSYGKTTDKVHTFGPYFSKLNVGRLTAGL